MCPVVVAGGCVGTANCPPVRAGSVGRSGRRGFGWLAAWFAGHRQHVDLSGVCVDGVNNGFGWACVVGKCCDAVPFGFALLGGFCDAF